MSLVAGTRLGPYEIQSAIGAGGMGEVYKARDTRLDRTVAIKILPADLSADPERRARFEREARAIASLSHPHICALFDIGEAVVAGPGGVAAEQRDGETPNPQSPIPSPQPVHYLVMEHLPGQTLADRLLKGPLPLAQALDIAAQIAEALDAAHKHGIVHRDLKPGNVMLTASGTGRSGVTAAKLLDFGLAKLKGHGELPALVSTSIAPTQAAPITARGTILGTLQYMAPEQLEGREADARTDLWALGAILYEMLTGKRAFAGDSDVSLIGNIMNAEPAALSSLQPLTPPSLDRVVKKCLAKHPDDRWDTAHDVADELRWIAQASSAAAMAPGRRASRRWLTAVVALGVLAAALAGFGAAWFMRPAPKASQPARVTVPIAPAIELMPITLGRTAFAWTPDGRMLVFAGLRDDRLHLYVRPIDASEARELPNTEDARVLAISPDSQWVAFWAASSGAPGAINKVLLAGGPAMTLASGIGLTEPPWGLAWGDTGRLFYAAQSGTVDGIWEVMPDGTTKAVVRLAEGEFQYALPFALPGGKTLLYTVRKRSLSWGGEQVVALTLATGARKVILNDAVDARYVSTGHLLFLRMGALYAVPFDPVRLEVMGKEVPAVDPVAQAVTGSSTTGTGAGQFAVSPGGALASVQSPIVPLPESRLVALDRRGQVTQLDTPARNFGNAVRVSPDGKRLAVVISTLADVGLWIYDVDSTRLNLFAGGEEARWPLWSRDGKSLYYLRMVNGRYETVVRAFDGSAPRPLVDAGIPSSLRPDGRQLATVYNQDIFTLDLDDEKAARRPLVADPKAVESWPEFSPDGRWLAYASDRSGRHEVYVRPYPGPGADEQVSIDGGNAPAWNPNGREIFFVSLSNANGQRTMMSAAFRAGSPPGRPQRLFDYDTSAYLIFNGWLRGYDVALDGERFYALQWVPVEPRPPVTHINLVLNWFEELTAKVPAGGVK